MMKHYAVIGAPIEHSLSPSLHQHFAREAGVKLEYTRILLDDAHFEQQVQDFFKAGGAGLNVTAPGKERAFAMSDVQTERCLKAGAANTLWLNAKGELCADNTDGAGLVCDLKKRIKLSGARILILGAGGAVRGILPALFLEKSQKIVVHNRTKVRAQTLVQEMDNKAVKCAGQSDMTETYDLVLNATGRQFAPPNELQGTSFCYDLTYDRSALTPFVHWARQKAYPAVDGFGMLVEQAREAFAVWRGMSASN